MRSIITSQKLAESDEINSTPMLACEGKCGGVTAHDFAYLELCFIGQPDDSPEHGLSLMYRCDTCGKKRIWGCIRWSKAVEIDPSIQGVIVR